jgi:hypothetical protein
MMKKLFFFFLFLFSLLSACTTALVETPTPSQESSSLGTSSSPPTPTPLVVPTQKPTREPTATRTRLPSITPGPTTTPYPTRTATLIPTFTPTHDPNITSTPVSVAQCPAENPDFIPVFNSPNEVHYHDQEILEFLNTGATRQVVITAYRQDHPQAEDWVIQEKDVTGDGVPEFIYTESLIRAMLYVYHCKDGTYELETALAEDFRFPALTILGIRDLNLDKIDEIIAVMGDDRTRFFYVLEWDGIEFRLLNFDFDIFDRSCHLMYGPSTIEFLDTDNNGTLELIMHQAIPIWSEYVEGLPWRKETRTCTWNGTLFVLTKTEFAPPKYRFQAVQDADRFALTGDYDRALDLYQQAIFSDQLDWWSEERWDHETQVALGNTAHLIPAPDAAEYFYLEAYSRFRIMLLHILRGYLPDAEIVYNTLQEKFPTGQPGYEFAEMTALFWNEYQISSDMGLACQKAIEYAEIHPGILAYLGDYMHGWQSIGYEPPDVCPFTPMP